MQIIPAINYKIKIVSLVALTMMQSYSMDQMDQKSSSESFSPRVGSGHRNVPPLKRIHSEPKFVRPLRKTSMERKSANSTKPNMPQIQSEDSDYQSLDLNSISLTNLADVAENSEFVWVVKIKAAPSQIKKEENEPLIQNSKRKPLLLSTSDENEPELDREIFRAPRKNSKEQKKSINLEKLNIPVTRSDEKRSQSPRKIKGSANNITISLKEDIVNHVRNHSFLFSTQGTESLKKFVVKLQKLQDEQLILRSHSSEGDLDVALMGESMGYSTLSRIAKQRKVDEILEENLNELKSKYVTQTLNTTMTSKSIYEIQLYTINRIKMDTVLYASKCSNDLISKYKTSHIRLAENTHKSLIQINQFMNKYESLINKLDKERFDFCNIMSKVCHFTNADIEFESCLNEASKLRDVSHKALLLMDDKFDIGVKTLSSNILITKEIYQNIFEEFTINNWIHPDSKSTQEVTTIHAFLTNSLVAHTKNHSFVFSSEGNSLIKFLMCDLKKFLCVNSFNFGDVNNFKNGILDIHHDYSKLKSGFIGFQPMEIMQEYQKVDHILNERGISKFEKQIYDITFIKYSIKQTTDLWNKIDIKDESFSENALSLYIQTSRLRLFFDTYGDLILRIEKERRDFCHLLHALSIDIPGDREFSMALKKLPEIITNYEDLIRTKKIEFEKLEEQKKMNEPKKNSQNALKSLK